MITYSPPADWHLGPLTVNIHSLMFFIGAMAAYIWTCKRLPEKYRDHADNLASWMTVCGIIGARALYAVLNFDQLESPIHAFYIWEGGLVSYGGFIGAIAAWLIYIRRNGLPLPVFCAAAAPAFLLGWGIGRIGCFLAWNNEYGTPAQIPWAFIVNGDVPRHPVMLYLSLGHIIMAFVSLRLAALWKCNPTGVALAAFGGVRLIFDIWRDYQPYWLHYGSAAISLTFVILGCLLIKRLPLPAEAAEK